MTIENDDPGRDRPDGTRPDSARRTGRVPVAVAGVISRFRWPILYVVTIAAMYWWYEIHPAAIAAVQLHGTWQLVEGELSDERPPGYFLHVEKHHRAWIIPPYDRRFANDSVTVRPADNFFVVEERFPNSSGDTTKEFIVCLKGDVLYRVRGLARFDPIKQPFIQKLHRVDSLPEDARKSIEAPTSAKGKSRTDR